MYSLGLVQPQKTSAAQPTMKPTRWIVLGFMMRPSFGASDRSLDRALNHNGCESENWWAPGTALESSLTETVCPETPVLNPILV
jgi:hypothetical protein